MADIVKDNGMDIYSIYKNYENQSVTMHSMTESDGKIDFHYYDEDETIEYYSEKEMVLKPSRVIKTEGDFLTICKVHNDGEIIRAYNYYKKVEPLISSQDKVHLLYNKCTFLEEVIDYFLVWYIENELDFPVKWKGFQLESLPQDITQKLLESLENDDYEITTGDEKIMQHNSFKLYRLKWMTKKNMRKNFSLILSDILKKPMTINDFNKYLNACSEYYKDVLYRSFVYACNAKDGDFYKKCYPEKFCKVTIKVNNEDVKGLAIVE